MWLEHKTCRSRERKEGKCWPKMPPPTSSFPPCRGRNQRAAPRAACRASMIPEFLCLLCFGLCAGQGIRMIDEPLPKPSLTAWPSSVMPPKGNVTLWCRTSTKDVNFVLRKGKVPLESVQSWISTDGPAEFQLTDLKTSSAGEYTCDYYRRGPPYTHSPPSDVLLLLVTGDLPKPSLQAHQRGEVTAGDTVTLQCQRPDNIFKPVMFALLKAGASGPIRVQSPVGKETDFSLQTVTAGDTGNYSCVYFLMKAPFLTSQPSHHLEIRVKAPPGAASGDYTTGNLVRLALAAGILLVLGALVAEAWCSQQDPARGSTFSS